MLEYVPLSDFGTLPSGEDGVYQFLGWIENGDENRMHRAVEVDGRMTNLYVESLPLADTLYADLDTHLYVLAANIIMRPAATITEYKPHQPYLSGRVPLAHARRNSPVTQLQGAFRVFDDERGRTDEYMLVAGIHDSTDGARFMVGRLSLLKSQNRY